MKVFVFFVIVTRVILIIHYIYIYHYFILSLSLVIECRIKLGFPIFFVFLFSSFLLSFPHLSHFFICSFLHFFLSSFLLFCLYQPLQFIFLSRYFYLEFFFFLLILLSLLFLFVPTLYFYDFYLSFVSSFPVIIHFFIVFPFIPEHSSVCLPLISLICFHHSITSQSFHSFSLIFVLPFNSSDVNVFLFSHMFFWGDLSHSFSLPSSVFLLFSLSDRLTLTNHTSFRSRADRLQLRRLKI